MIGICKRNLKVFFRDRAAVFYSLMAVFIIIGLYILFLGDIWVENVEHSFPGVNGVSQVMDCWIMAGILAVGGVESVMGAFGVMVSDRAKKITKDFYVAPVKRSSIIAGYVVSSYLISLIMSAVTLALAQIYLLSKGGAWLSPKAYVLAVLVLMLSNLAGSAMVLFLVTSFQSEHAFSTASTVIGTLIGFITGIYLPISMYPGAVQWVIKLFPISHGAALLRQILMEGPMETYFAWIPQSGIEEFELAMGCRFRFGEITAPPWISAAVLAATTVLFYGLAVWNFSRKKKN